MMRWEYHEQPSAFDIGKGLWAAAVALIVAVGVFAGAHVAFAAETAAPELQAGAVQTQDVYAVGSYNSTADWDFYVLPNGTATITGYSGSATSVSIPASLNGHTVTAIKSLSGMSNVKSITIPKTVKSIGYYADYTAQDWKDFGCWTEMKGVYAATVNVFRSIGTYNSNDDFVPTLKTINVAKGSKAFKSVKGVLFNKKGTKLLAFPNAKSGKYTIPKKVKSVAPYAFTNATCKQVKTSPKMKKIAPYAFYYAEIKEVKIAKGTKSIGMGAFRYAGNEKWKFSSVKIPGSVKTIGKYAFQGSSLKSVSLGNGVKTIGISAFSNTRLTKVKLPKSVKTVMLFAFRDCYKLKTIKLNAGLKTIGVGAFESTAVKSITIPASVSKIATSGKEAYKYTDGESYSYTYAGNPFMTLYKYKCVYSDGSVSQSDHYYLDHNVTYDVNKYKKGAKSSWALCDKLQTIKVAKGNKKYAAKGGVLFNKKMTALIAYPAAKKGSKYTIPKKVKTVCAGAFAWNQKLKSVSLSKNLKKIGDRGFYNTNIGALTLPAKVSSAGYGAFSSSWTPQTYVADDNGASYTDRGPLTLTVPSAVANRLRYTTTNIYDFGNYNVNVVIK